MCSVLVKKKKKRKKKEKKGRKKEKSYREVRKGDQVEANPGANTLSRVKNLNWLSKLPCLLEASLSVGWEDERNTSDIAKLQSALNTRPCTFDWQNTSNDVCRGNNLPVT